MAQMSKSELRDQAAIAEMQAIVANGGRQIGNHIVASSAFEIADAMVSARGFSVGRKTTAPMSIHPKKKKS
jgi:hypothetical protein